MRLLTVLATSVLLTACNSTKEGSASVSSNPELNGIVKDSIEYYETDVEVRQRNYFAQLQGRWVVDTMRRQARMQPDVLKEAWLQFNADSSLNLYAGCNRIRGGYLLKGTGIRFQDMASTRMACPDDVEGTMLQLLQNTVSAYSIDGERLMLRDGAGNVVFSASKEAAAKN